MNKITAILSLTQYADLPAPEGVPHALIPASCESIHFSVTQGLSTFLHDLYHNDILENYFEKS